MKVLIKIIVERLWKNGKITTIAGATLSGLAHNLFPNASPELLAIIDMVCGALISAKDKQTPTNTPSNELPAN